MIPGRAKFAKPILKPEKPARRLPARTRFKAHRGRGHAAAFRAHKGFRPKYPAYRAHAKRAIIVWKPKPVSPIRLKAAKVIRYKSLMRSVPAAYRGRKVPAKYKSIGGRGYPVRKKPARYRPVRPRG